MEGSDPGSSAGRIGVAGMLPPAIVIAGVASVVAILGAKFFLAARINVSWDEFYFLSHVYALERGELDLLLQGAYTHAFRWVTATGGGEVDQVVRLRLLMCALLAVSAWLTYASARQFASRTAALLALLAWLSAWPVMKHGASFRADSMLLPLTLAAFWLALRGDRRRDAVLAGVSFGLAFVVTVKAVLLMPALAAAFLLRRDAGRADARRRAGAALPALALMFGAAALVAAGLLALHATQVVAGSEQVGAFASRSFAESIAEVPFLPRRDVALAMVAEDPVYWIAAAAGLLLALRSRAWDCAALGLAFLPLLFYRNAFPYFFPVMMAPAAALIAVAADRLLTDGPPPWRAIRLATLAILTAALTLAAWDGAMALRFDEQAGQRAVVAAVHRVFPKPVRYIDHGAMIASYPKVGFFMSSWGVEAYRRRGVDFMPAVLADRCPPLLLANHPVLVPGSLLNRQLRAEDRRLMEERYVDYWGPIRVAGAVLEVAPGKQATVRVPCTGFYRLEAGSPVVLDGLARGDGDVIELVGERDYAVVAPTVTPEGPVMRLVWADAQPAPVGPPPTAPLYRPL